MSGRISGGVHTYPIFLCLSLLPLNPPRPVPATEPPCAALASASGVRCCCCAIPEESHSHRPRPRHAPIPRQRPALLPLAPSYTARALLFAEPVSVCRGVACSVRGRVYTGGVAPALQPARVLLPAAPAPQSRLHKTDSQTDPEEQVSDPGPRTRPSWVLAVPSHPHTALCASRPQFPSIPVPGCVSRLLWATVRVLVSLLKGT